MPEQYTYFISGDNVFLVSHYRHHAECNGVVFPYYENADELAFLCMNATNMDYGRLENSAGQVIANVSRNY